MTDKIEPVLTPEEWVYWLGESGELALKIHGACDGVAYSLHQNAAALMALANAALPDDSPYKITRDWIALLVVAQVEARKAVGVDCISGPCDECRAACERFCVRLQHMADVIAALLPPE